MADTSLLFNIVGHDRTGPAFRSAADGASKLGGRLKVGLAAGIAALGGIGAGAVVLGKQMIDIASDTNEAMSKTSVVFGKSAKAVIDFSSTSAAQYGISKRAALDYTSAMGSVLVAQGESQASAQKTSLEYTKLAADMASFSNTSIDEASEALKASLTGEFEQLKKYGIVINDVRLAEEAKRLGMVRAGATWSAQQKKLLSYNIVMHDTAQMQGDFGRTSSGLANQQRILSARIEDLKGKWGAKLLPVAIKVVGWLIKMLDVIDGLGRVFAPAAKAVQVFIWAFKGESSPGEFEGSLNKINRAGIKIGDWIRNDFLPAAKRFGAWIRDEAIPATRQFVSKLWADLQPAIKQISKSLREDIVPAIRGMIQKFREAWPTISRVLHILGEIAGFILRRVVPVLIKFYAKYLATVIRVFGQVFSAGWKIIGFLLDLGKGVGKAAKKFWDFVTDVKDAISDFKKKVSDGIDKVIDFFKKMPGRIADGIGNLAKTLYNKGLDLIQGFFDGIGDKIKSAPGWMGKLVVKTVEGLADAADMHSPSRLMMKYGRWFAEGFGIGVKDKTGDVVDKAKEMIDKLREKIQVVKDFAREIRDAFVQTSDLSTMDFSGWLSDDEPAQALLPQLQQKAYAAAEFAKNFDLLRRKGLNATTLGQLRDAGPESALGAMRALIHGGSAGIVEVNKLVAQIDAVGRTFGDSEARRKYGFNPNGPQTVKVKSADTHVKLSFDFTTKGAEGALVEAIRKAVRVRGGNVQVVFGK